jgi:hypothetical protein
VKLERMAARLSVVAALVLGSIFLPSSGLVPHRLSASANVGVQNMFDGFDRCDAPGTGTMSTCFSSSPLTLEIRSPHPPVPSRFVMRILGGHLPKSRSQLCHRPNRRSEVVLGRKHRALRYK